MILPQWLMPSILAFGPVFIVIGLTGVSISSTIFSYVGAVMVSLSLVSLRKQIIDLEKDIREQKSRNV
jgi:predicted membrane metal-binding protein